MPSNSKGASLSRWRGHNEGEPGQQQQQWLIMHRYMKATNVGPAAARRAGPLRWDFASVAVALLTRSGTVLLPQRKTLLYKGQGFIDLCESSSHTLSAPRPHHPSRMRCHSHSNAVAAAAVAQPEQARRSLYQRVIGSMPDSDSLLAGVVCDVLMSRKRSAQQLQPSQHSCVWTTFWVAEFAWKHCLCVLLFNFNCLSWVFGQKI